MFMFLTDGAADTAAAAGGSMFSLLIPLILKFGLM